MVVHSILLRCLAQDEKCVKAVSLCFHLWHCLIQSVFDFSIIVYIVYIVYLLNIVYIVYMVYILQILYILYLFVYIVFI